MKVVFTHTDFRIYWPARLNALNKYLKERNVQFDIIEIAGAGSPYSFSIDTGTLPQNWHCLFPDKKIENISSKEANRALRRKLDEISPDIVFAGAIAFPSGAAAVRWAADNKRKVIIFDNSRLQDVPRPWGVNFVKRNIYSCVDAVFCPSHAWNETFNYFGFQNNQIFYGLNVVDNGFWQNMENNKKEDSSGNYILTIGRQVAKKNFLFLIKAYLVYVKKEPAPKEMILVGDGPIRQILEEFVRKNSLKTIRFIPFVSQEQLKDLYRNASYFVLPSRFGETWGLVVNEAMASGLPVLVSNQVGCASTLIREGENGFTFSPDKIEDLAGLFSIMHNLPDNELRKMGQKSEGIISEWGLDRFCSGVYQAILQVTDNVKKRPELLNRVIMKLWKGRYRPV